MLLLQRKCIVFTALKENEEKWNFYRITFRTVLFKVKRSIISKEPYNHTFFREHDKDICQIWLNVAFLQRGKNLHKKRYFLCIEEVYVLPCNVGSSKFYRIFFAQTFSIILFDGCNICTNQHFNVRTSVGTKPVRTTLSHQFTNS